jgi:hypothetical protein
MGVDYERLAFWDELVCEGRLGFRSPDKFLDQERLKAALVALDLDLPIGLVVDDIVDGVADWISVSWIAHSVTKWTPGPDEYIDDQEGYHLHRNDSDKKDALVQLASKDNVLQTTLLHLCQFERKSQVSGTAAMALACPWAFHIP